VKRVVVLALAAAVAVALLVTRDPGSGAAQAAVARAAALTVDAGSSRFSLRSDSADQGPAFAADGEMDYAHHRGRIHSLGDIEMIVDGDVEYWKFSVPWHDDARWVRLHKDADDVDPLDLQERALHNPVGLLEFLRGAGDVREVGDDVVRGTETTHYEGTLDLQRVVDQSPPAEREELQWWLDFLAEHAPTTVPFDLWVDRDGVAHRLRIDDERDAPTLIEFYDFGVDVDVTPPAHSMSDDEFFAEMEKHADASSCEGGGICTIVSSSG
jgi:hypothetical protein